MNTIFIGIAGGTGSGKTTLTEHLAARFGSDISVVHHDNYYKRQDRPFAERCLQNYDHPDAFDTDLMIEDLKALKRGETIHCPVYDYAIHNRTDETVEIKPTKVVIVEGILIFQNDSNCTQIILGVFFFNVSASSSLLFSLFRKWFKRRFSHHLGKGLLIVIIRFILHDPYPVVPSSSSKTRVYRSSSFLGLSPIRA